MQQSAEVIYYILNRVIIEMQHAKAASGVKKKSLFRINHDTTGGALKVQLGTNSVVVEPVVSFFPCHFDELIVNRN